jgi:transcriptional regulator with XRE-family HTH domain
VISESGKVALGNSGEPIGRALYRMRRKAGFSGHALAGMANLSQSKISRIETGVVLPNPDDVEALLRALGEDDDVILRFREWAAASIPGHDDEDPSPGLIGRFQETYVEYEARARTIRLFQPTLIPGLLQTSEYARSLISRSCDVLGIDYQVEGASAVARRLDRQKVIYDPDKSLTFTMLESVLDYRVTSPAAMIAQLDFVLEVSRRDNVRILVIPDGTDLLVPTGSSVEIFDGRQALAETLIGIQPYTLPADIESLVTILDYLEGEATSEIDAIVDHHRHSYLERLR